MKKLFTILLICFFTINAKAQSANAGSDVTIYLTSTSTATLDGSASSGTSFFWTEISSDYMSGATITSPTSKTTTVTGLPQGTFYFQIAATTGATTKLDTMVVRVDVDAPPSYSTLHRNLLLSDTNILHTINWRGDTTTFFPTNNALHSTMISADGQRWNIYRDRINGFMIDSSRGKIRSQIHDGYHSTSDNFERAELELNSPDFYIDTTKILMYEWKGYFPSQPLYMQNRSDNIGALFQVHTSDASGSGGLGFGLSGDSSITFTFYQSTTGGPTLRTTVGSYKDWVNKTHTIRMYLREGYGFTNNPSFVVLWIDGVQQFIHLGSVGGASNGDYHDYFKFGTLYDYGNRITQYDNTTRNRQFNLTTESMKQYVITQQPPLVDVGPNKIITLPTTTVTLTGTATPYNTTIASYLWTELSGGSVTIASPSSLTTTVTGLASGQYQFNLKVTDANGQITNMPANVKVETNPIIAGMGYTKDVLVDPVLNGTPSTLTTGSIDGSGFYFYGKGFSTTSTPLPVQFGLPANGTIISQTNTLYQLQAYNANNSLRINSGASGTFTLTTPQQFAKIKILLNSGSTRLGYQINYTDATHDNDSLTIPDWGCTTCGIYAINQLGRIDNTGLIESNYWSMAEDSIIPNPAKTVSSITFSPASSWVNIFAFSVGDNYTIDYPIVNAGNDTTTTLTTITLKGSVISNPSDPATYIWTKISGNGTQTITNNTTLTPTITGLQTGTYVFRLTAQDSHNGNYDNITVTVNAPAVPYLKLKGKVIFTQLN